MNIAPAILIMIHCEEHTGYAISSLEHVFHQSALAAGYSNERIFWSYNGLKDAGAGNKIDCDYRNPNPATLVPFLRNNNIQTVIAFDLGYPAKVISLLKDNGVKKIISYWGASMSSINTGLKLWLKKAEFFARRNTPDHFVFESEAMRRTATHGRGVPAKATSVLYLGVDTEKFSPNYGKDFYAHEQLGIPQERKIIFYSGHMEERKGVRTIINAAIHMATTGSLQNIQFVLCGNKGDEAKTYTDMLAGTAAEPHVTFAGYRKDIAALMRSSSIGVIASTGWDSFTMSSVEMMASGLPLIVSNLQGLSETIENHKNGFLISPGNHTELAEKIFVLCTDTTLAQSFSKHSRQRAEQNFSVSKQIKTMANILR
ncbi:glycosyltransferase family 4 protein [Cellvibrio sp. OA-2007]|uniref:glycosyltransferase family 4 protein n=1 Tax=Cellvibrio sp. OA-2007 TaxID=529823 RepID=UPI000785B6BA|nr:glycosyltransferase family 4 protein [Cellvibrio sp. OA-2007]